MFTARAGPTTDTGRRHHGVPAPDRHAELVDRAADVFFVKGYDAASIRDVAEEVGLLKGSLYHYIDSKEDLLFDIVADVHASLRRLAEQVTGDDPVADLRAIMVGHAEYVADHYARAGVCAREFSRLSPRRRAEVYPDRLAYEQALVSLIDRGQRRALVRPDVSPSVVSKGVLGMLNILPHWYHADGPLSATDIGHQLADLAIDGLTGPASGAATSERSAG